MEEMKQEENPSLRWQSPSRNLHLIMVNTIWMKRILLQRSQAKQWVSWSFLLITDLLTNCLTEGSSRRRIKFVWLDASRCTKKGKARLTRSDIRLANWLFQFPLLSMWVWSQYNITLQIFLSITMAAHGGFTDSQESLDISRDGNDSPPSSLPTLDKDYNLIGHLKANKT